MDTPAILLPMLSLLPFAVVGMFVWAFAGALLQHFLRRWRWCGVR